jgi:hypothetical protein
VARHDRKLIEWEKANVQPAEMAQLLKNEFGYKEDEVTGKKISDRLTYLRRNGLAPLRPVSTNEHLLSKPPQKCMYSICCCLFSV